MPALISNLNFSKKGVIPVFIGILLSIIAAIAAIHYEAYYLPLIPVIILAVILALVFIFREPFVGFLATIIYTFFFGILGREFAKFIFFPVGFGIEILLLLTLLSVWYNAHKINFSCLNNNLVYIFLVWLLLSIFEIVNPAGASVMGWLQEIRSAAIQPFLITVLAFLLINSFSRIKLTLSVFLFCSIIATLYGLRQQFFGLTAGEQAFLNAGAAKTHMLNGKLRVFSFYGDAGQFGASQAQFSLFCIILGLAFTKFKHKVIYFFAAILFFYGMLISGTRGALFALLAGAFVAVLLTKKVKFIAIGLIAVFMFVGFLKFTDIGNSNYGIYRMRTALNPEDASLNVRFNSQRMLKEYMASHPFGGGLGVIGSFGHAYNSDKFLSTIEPDSYWVKVWAMYGIVGLVIFFSGWMYIIGKCFGIIWNIDDREVKGLLTALLASVVGIFACSYGNEVMNGKPSIFVLHIALAIIFTVPILMKNSKDFTPKNIN